jgi:hypothetical protein
MYAIKDKEWGLWICDLGLTPSRELAKKFRLVARAREYATAFRKTYPATPIRVVAWQ